MSICPRCDKTHSPNTFNSCGLNYEGYIPSIWIDKYYVVFFKHNNYTNIYYPVGCPSYIKSTDIMKLPGLKYKLTLQDIEKLMVLL